MTIAAAGVIPRLVEMLGPGSATDKQSNASASALAFLALNPWIAFAIAAAGAIPLLVQQLQPGSPAEMRRCAARALTIIARGSPAIGAAVAREMLVTGASF
ncbi:hypothetical protein FOA52_005670 [Chlamydomonas sp. UWO 241]|nr:hypothetical protein FOA52_005670 [Chlamydomonas sp. UWO 241]